MILTATDLKKEWEDFKSLTAVQLNQHISIGETETIIYAAGDKKIYYPSPTGYLFHQSNEFVRVVMGPYGSGKTTMCLQEIVRRAANMPVWSNGRRRSRWAIIRNTAGELETTTLQSWLTWFAGLGDVYRRKKPVLTYEHTFNDDHGVIELELIFIPLDDDKAVRKIKSLELTGAYINELSEIPASVLAHMKGRVNRYPSRAFCEERYWSGIIADTNPPEDDHWIHEMFEKKTLANHHLYKQPPGLLWQDGAWVNNPEAENSKFLANDYYVNLAEGQTKDFVKVFCLGQYGTVGFDKCVYPEFNTDFHAVEKLDAIQGEPLLLGWDFGLTPACVVLQLTPRGNLFCLKEYVAEDMGIKTFAESIVLPGIARDFPYNKIGRSVADPAGVMRSQVIEEMSCIGELENLGIKTEPARTNDIEPRLAAVRFFLNRMVDGKPAFLLDKSQCPTLLKGFVKNYIYKRLAVKGEARYKSVPHKNMASHPMDALGYGCLELAAERIVQDKSSHTKPVDMWNPIARVM